MVEIALSQATRPQLLLALRLAAAEVIEKNHYKGLSFGCFGGRHWKLEGISSSHSLHSIFQALEKGSREGSYDKTQLSSGLYDIQILRGFGSDEIQKQSSWTRALTKIKSIVTRIFQRNDTHLLLYKNFLNDDCFEGGVEGLLEGLLGLSKLAMHSSGVFGRRYLEEGGSDLWRYNLTPDNIDIHDWELPLYLEDLCEANANWSRLEILKREVAFLKKASKECFGEEEKNFLKKIEQFEEVISKNEGLSSRVRDVASKNYDTALSMKALKDALSSRASKLPVDVVYNGVTIQQTDSGKKIILKLSPWKTVELTFVEQTGKLLKANNSGKLDISESEGREILALFDAFFDPQAQLIKIPSSEEDYQGTRLAIEEARKNLRVRTNNYTTIKTKVKSLKTLKAADGILLANLQASYRALEQANKSNDRRLSSASQHAQVYLNQCAECIQILSQDSSSLKGVGPFFAMETLIALTQALRQLDYFKLEMGLSKDCGVVEARGPYESLSAVLSSLDPKCSELIDSVINSTEELKQMSAVMGSNWISRKNLDGNWTFMAIVAMKVTQLPSFELEEMRKGLDRLDAFDIFEAEGREAREFLANNLSKRLEYLARGYHRTPWDELTIPLTEEQQKLVSSLRKELQERQSLINEQHAIYIAAEIAQEQMELNSTKEEIRKEIKGFDTLNLTEFRSHFVAGKGANGYYIQTREAFDNFGVQGFGGSVSLGRDGNLWINGSNTFTKGQADQALKVIKGIKRPASAKEGPEKTEAKASLLKEVAAFEHLSTNIYLQQKEGAKAAKREVQERVKLLADIQVANRRVAKPEQTLLKEMTTAYKALDSTSLPEGFQKRDNLLLNKNRPVLEFDPSGNLIKLFGATVFSKAEAEKALELLNSLKNQGNQDSKACLEQLSHAVLTRIGEANFQTYLAVTKAVPVGAGVDMLVVYMDQQGQIYSKDPGNAISSLQIGFYTPQGEQAQEADFSNHRLRVCRYSEWDKHKPVKASELSIQQQAALEHLLAQLDLEIGLLENDAQAVKPGTQYNGWLSKKTLSSPLPAESEVEVEVEVGEQHQGLIQGGVDFMQQRLNQQA